MSRWTGVTLAVAVCALGVWAAVKLAGGGGGGDGKVPIGGADGKGVEHHPTTEGVGFPVGAVRAKTPPGAPGDRAKDSGRAGDIGSPSSRRAVDSNEIANDPDVKLLVKGLNEFAIDLYKEIAKTEKGNIFFSPFSISSALAMTYAGARGKTAEDTAKALHFREELTKGDGKRLHTAFGKLLRHLNAENSPDGNKRANTLTVANALWTQKGFAFLGDFVDLNRTAYDAQLEEVDFVNAPDDACTRINDWVRVRTKDRILHLVGPDQFGAETRLVVTNAVYFKAYWEWPFKPHLTSREPFYVSADNQRDVPMMQQTQELRYMAGGGFQACELPYEGERSGMLVFLPDKKADIKDFEKKWSGEEFGAALEKLSQCELELFLPKMHIRWNMRLSGSLRELGTRRLFTLGEADLSGVTRQTPLCLSEMVHEAVLNVNEKSTEAVAATAGLVGTSYSPPAAIFRADHPFLVLIRDNTSRAILFMGRIADPTNFRDGVR